jgi:glycosyl transferase family 87
VRDSAELRRQPALELPALIRTLLAAVALPLLLTAAPAGAQAPGSAPPPDSTLTITPLTGGPPPGRERTAKDVVATALADPKVRETRDEHPSNYVRAYLKDDDRWQVSVFARGRGPDKEIAQVYVDDGTGRVTEAWTGVQVEWTMARGYRGAFGRRSNALYLWLPLVAMFLLPFLRPPWRLVHLDLAAVASLSVSFAFFNHAEIGASVPLAYPPLAYLLVRLLLLARARGAGRSEPPLRMLLSVDTMLMAIVFLLGLRVGLLLASANVIDVGYASVIGADRITHGQPLYGHFPTDNEHGDTYGPLNYLAYVPFELLAPWHGEWDDLPSGRLAAFAFDLACLGLLYLAGRRLRGHATGVLLSYLWLTCPFTLLVVTSGANDALVGATVLGAFLLAARPFARGLALGAAALTKFAPLALAPLFAGYRGGWGRALAGLAVALALGLGFVLVLDGGLQEFWDRTIAFQADRGSPFSIWGWYDLPALQLVAQAAAAALALAVAVVPRRRDEISLAALAAAVLIAVQLTVDHWFYLYVVWFLPLVFVASVAGAGRSTGSIESARREDVPRMATALSQGSSSAAS